MAPAATARRKKKSKRSLGQSLPRGRTHETSKENPQTRPDRRASEGAPGEPGLQLDRTSAHQHDAGQSESRSPARGKNGDAREKRFAPRPAHRAGRASPERCGQEIVRRYRATLGGSERRLHADREARRAEERFG